MSAIDVDDVQFSRVQFTLERPSCADAATGIPVLSARKNLTTASPQNPADERDEEVNERG